MRRRIIRAHKGLKFSDLLKRSLSCQGPWTLAALFFDQFSSRQEHSSQSIVVE